VNLFSDSKKTFDVKGQNVTIFQETSYPNDGDVKLTFSTPIRRSRWRSRFNSVRPVGAIRSSCG
jgi:DUF1680 family protein